MSGLLIVLGGMLLFYGMVAVYLYAIVSQVRYIVTVWRSEIPLWKKLLAPAVMVAWALPPVLAVCMKRWSEMSGQPPEAWQWCVSAVGIGVLWCVSVWLCRALMCFSWRRSICVSLAIFAIYTVMLLGICPGKPLDASQTEVQYHE